MIPLLPRAGNFSVLDEINVTAEGAQRLSEAAINCWQAILEMDLPAFGNAFRQSFEAQIAMFPLMADESIHQLIDQYRHQALGWKLSGAGGGGYLILVSETPIENAIQIKILRKE